MPEFGEFAPAVRRPNLENFPRRARPVNRPDGIVAIAKMHEIPKANGIQGTFVYPVYTLRFLGAVWSSVQFKM